MAPFGTIYSYPGNPRVQRVSFPWCHRCNALVDEKIDLANSCQAQVVAELNGLELNIPGPDEFQMTTAQTPEFLAKWPLGKVPVFEGADGFCLAEGAAIAQYLAASGPKAAQLLGGTDVQAKAKIAEWTLFTETELVAHALPFLYVFMGFAQYDEKTHGDAAGKFQRALGKVEAAVKGGKKHLVGEELTLADLMVAAYLFQTSTFLFDAEMRKSAPATAEWLKEIAALPVFSKYFGEYKPVEKRVGA